MIAFVFSILAAVAAQGAHVSEETQIGSSTQIQAITADGEFNERSEALDPLAHLWNWNAGYTHSRSSSQHSTLSGQSTVIDDTEEWTGGFGFLSDGNFGTDLTLLWSSTPAEALTSDGGEVTFSYKFVFNGSHVSEEASDHSDAVGDEVAQADGGDVEGNDSPDATSDDTSDDSSDESHDFSPSLKLKAKFGKKTYEERFFGSRTSRVKGKSITLPTSGSVYLEDTYYSPVLTWRPSEPWSIELSYQLDVYSQDVAQFQGALDSTRAIAAGAGNFTNTVGGLSQATDSLTISRELGGWATAILLESYSISAADLSPSYNTSLKFEFQLPHSIDLVLGVAYQSSNTSYDTIGTLGLGAKF